MKIYLAGGMRTNWQENVKNEVSFQCIDPADKEKVGEWDVNMYGAWDFHHIKQCDVMFAYMERTNTGGIGMSVEMGYAYGIGKTVILVLEDNNEGIPDRYLQFQTKAAHMVFDNLEDGINFLKTFK